MKGIELLKNINAFILAGGQSKRFGTDKALYNHRGKPLISYSAERLDEQFKQLTIIAKEASVYEHLGYIVIEDLLSFRTPLAGIYTGLRQTKMDWNFFLGCDMPLITMEAIKKLAQGIADSSDDTEIVVPKTKQGLQPLAAFYHRSLAASFLETADQVYSIKDFLRKKNTKVVEFQSEKPFLNVNTKEQLEHID